jgi:CheY-like chemotaxis protein
MGSVLVVDDDAEVRDTIACILEEEGFTVVRAENGRAALAKMDAEPNGVSAVLLDLMMPVMTGQELLAVLAERGVTSVPVIVMSAYVRGDVVLPAVCRTLKKPFGLDDLVNAVTALRASSASTEP